MSEEARGPSGKMGGEEKPVSCLKGAGRPGWDFRCPSCPVGLGRLAGSGRRTGGRPWSSGARSSIFSRDRPFIKPGGTVQFISRAILLLADEKTDFEGVTYSETQIELAAQN